MNLRMVPPLVALALTAVGLFAHVERLFAGGLFQGLAVGLRLHLRTDGVLLCNQQATDLQELVGLLAGELVGVLDRFHLPLRRTRFRLQAFELARVGGEVPLLLLQALEQRVVGLFLRFGCQAAVLFHRLALGVRATGGREAWRAAVVGHVLELAQVGVDAARLVLVVVQSIHGLHQPIDGGLRLVPDVGGRRDGVLQHVFVLLQLRPVLLDLLLDLRHLLNRGDSGSRPVGAVEDRDARVRRHRGDANSEGYGESDFSR